MPCSASFSSLFELRPLAEDLTPNEFQGLLPLFAAIAPPPKLKLCSRIGSGSVSKKLTDCCRRTVFDEIPHLPKTVQRFLLKLQTTHCHQFSEA